MPTISPAPLMNLVEHRPGDSSLCVEKRNPDSENGVPSARHLYIAPALYTTPKQAPIPESFSTDRALVSPYLVNHKSRRGLGVDPSQPSDMGEEKVVNDFGNDEFDGENDDFRSVDARSEASVMGAAESFSSGRIDSSSASGFGEFIDANEDFSEDGSVSNSPLRRHNLEEVLHSTRLNVVEEMERRKAAEETVMLMKSQWERIRGLFSEAGLTFPAPPASVDTENDSSCIDQLLQELVVSRCVAAAVAGGLARAETEQVFSAIIQSKDQEIQRLHGRLQYYETVNHEMSQRKLVEAARRQQQKKRNRRLWMWSLMGLSVVAVGSSFVAAYAYTSTPNESSPSGNELSIKEEKL